METLHVHSGNLYGGVESTLLAQARHQDSDLNLNLSFALCFEGRFSHALKSIGAPVYWLDNVRLRNPYLVRRARQRLSRLLKRQHFDLAVTHSAWAQVLFGPVIKAQRLPLIFSIHGVTRPYHWLERWASKTVPDLVLCNSQFTSRTVEALYPTAPSRILYPPYDFEPAHLSDSARSAIRKKLNTPRDAIVVIQVSRMEEGKGHPLHLKALHALKNLPRWYCWIVSETENRREARYQMRLAEMAAALGIERRIRFVGHDITVSELLGAADIFCQPNLHPEGFGLSFIEAMLAKLPVVTTRMGAAQEIMDERCGLLISVETVDALARALRDLIQNKAMREKIGNNGAIRASQLCDMNRQMRKFLSYSTNNPLAAVH
jgi:glycosyltransferase involved in cell wall biosynthesis